MRFLFVLIFVTACQQKPKVLEQTAGHSCTPTNSRFTSVTDQKPYVNSNQSVDLLKAVCKQGISFVYYFFLIKHLQNVVYLVNFEINKAIQIMEEYFNEK